MFDDLKPNNQGGARGSNLNNPPTGFTPPPAANAGYPSNQPPSAPATDKPVEDMFSETEPSKPELLKPREQMTAEERQVYDQKRAAGVEPPAGQTVQKIFLAITVVAGLGLLGIGGFWGYKAFTNKAADNTVIQNAGTTNSIDNTSKVPVIEPAPTVTPPVDTSANNTGPAVQPVISASSSADTVDSDNDGLTDAEEKTLGTDPNNPDTDNDGLFDREEVKVYHTDPKNPDTDGDGFKDGAEVKNGYNPNGPGKLYDFNK